MKNSFIFTFLFFSIFSFGIEVEIKDNKMIVDGKPFYMKGICYHPVKIGKTKRSFESLTEDLILIKEAGINTLRVYEPIDDIDVLDELQAAGVKVVISFGYNQKGRFDIVSGTFIDYVKKYKNHEAILMWELGNEYNYNPQWFGGDINNWYKAMELVSRMIQIEDPNRLVSSAHGDLPSKDAISIASSVQVWGMNVYRWDEPESIFNEWKAISDKPMYFAELGADSYMTKSTEKYTKGENQLAQADANKIKWQPEILTAGGTDTAGLQQRGKNGSIAGAISIPTRHLHQVIEMAHKEDIQGSIDLLQCVLKNLDQRSWEF